jgi:hypothetical protein
LIDKNWFQKLSKSMEKTLKNSEAILIAQCLHCTDLELKRTPPESEPSKSKPEEARTLIN